MSPHTQLWLGDLPDPDARRAALDAVNSADEATIVNELIADVDLSPSSRRRIDSLASELVTRLRTVAAKAGGLDAFMHEYDLSSREGVTLMCLAEALLRVPDPATADRLIADKLGGADWERHLGQAPSLFVNASTWALMLTGRLMRLDEGDARQPLHALRRLVARSGEPLIRQAMIQAMRIIGRQFVMGRSIGEALERARPAEARGFRHSYDMLGESALTRDDAARYFRAYEGAIAAVAQESQGRGPISGPGISIKLSALHPRFEVAQWRRVRDELIPTVISLAQQARTADIGFCIDTEEADRLAVTIDVLDAVLAEPGLAGWDGCGLAVQAYQKRGRPLVTWLTERARAAGRRLSVRLVKGAYWDAEIKRAQEQGLDGYPVFTRKCNTDASYLACAKALLAAPDAFYPQFATHNAQTLAAVIELAGNDRAFEFQRLHGMGEPLYQELAGRFGSRYPCRIYAPVGSHQDLLAYLVRRLLENGSNTSFVNRIVDASLPVAAIVADPISVAASRRSKAHPQLPLPRDLYGAARRNSRGIDLADAAELSRLRAEMPAPGATWAARPMIAAPLPAGLPRRAVVSPADLGVSVGEVFDADDRVVAAAVAAAAAGQRVWERTPVEDRAACLERAADGYEAARAELVALLVGEAGKTIGDALGEIRETVDFARYYAAEARRLFAHGWRPAGPTGEFNTLEWRGRGPFVCISPWNFPLAIFTGQAAAALAAGNAVLAKPAEQTPLIAARSVEILHAAGIPRDVLQLLPGDGRIGAALVAADGIGGVAFTGASATARAIHQRLAERGGPIIPLIAETGGINAMIVDSTALAEQVVHDAITSAFRSAGQRCSALRVLFLQEEIAARVKTMLAGAMAELKVGHPAFLATDVGPVIDGDALARLTNHRRRMEQAAMAIGAAPLSDECAGGLYFAPCAFGIDGLRQLEDEVFGPCLHVIEYPGARLDQVIDAINATGYGLTLGIHSRIESKSLDIYRRLRTGNTYINRNMIGAVVGVQPFGGEGLSGTGPKAGGPHYLLRFATERTLTIDTTAAGGNAQLLSLADDADDADDD
ncbi:MAG: bifunctional proline dehydrogenase/L-glutamate gamma-semialdehyde dehydrogenase PutA [Rhodospirillales bacterium]|jgi:RHH-type proline utilization regulon transcriptional repressor/proline dehydrogenase/delta 1-pyrroline-5-carboxylate dehydrogenase|nr:bifunctional proline dehydrogenase/L-glutamate gamma-semialdehyde dehydrogenase PutA [Rhodospirillales bacterium]